MQEWLDLLPLHKQIPSQPQTKPKFEPAVKSESVVSVSPKTQKVERQAHPKPLIVIQKQPEPILTFNGEKVSNPAKTPNLHGLKREDLQISNKLVNGDTYQYELRLQVKDAINSDCLYQIELTENEEDDPEQLRQKIESKKSDIYEKIQKQYRHLVPPRRILMYDLEQILETWMENILEGQFLTILTRDIPILISEDLVINP